MIPIDCLVSRLKVNVKGQACLNILRNGKLVCWFAEVRTYVASAIFQPYLDLEAGNNQSIK